MPLGGSHVADDCGDTGVVVVVVFLASAEMAAQRRRRKGKCQHLRDPRSSQGRSIKSIEIWVDSPKIDTIALSTGAIWRVSSHDPNRLRAIPVEVRAAVASQMRES